MTSLLFDTNILIDQLRGVTEANQELAPSVERSVSITTWMELLAGAAPDLEPDLRNYLQTFRLLEASTEIYNTTVQVRRQYRMKLPDAIIYATALVHDLTLVTRNTRDFHENMPGVRIPYRL